MRIYIVPPLSSVFNYVAHIFVSVINYKLHNDAVFDPCPGSKPLAQLLLQIFTASWFIFSRIYTVFFS